MVEDPKIIAKQYLKGWFFVDILSIIPFDIIFAKNFSKLTRFMRMGQLYRLIRLTRMVRIIKVFKDRTKITKNMTEILRMGIGFERFVYMMFIYLLAQHIIACVW